MNYYLLKQIVIYSRSRSKKNHQKTKPKCRVFLFLGHSGAARGRARTRERVRGRSAGCLLGKVCLLVLRERGREVCALRCALSAGDRREVPRKYEQTRVLSEFLFVQTHPLRRSALVCRLQCKAHGESLWRVRAAEVLRAVQHFVQRFSFSCSSSSLLLLLYPKGGLFVICWLLGICWQFREGWKRWFRERRHC